ncbi:MAG: STAS domain-containing protein [Betaproteobacteria bacterium]|nr:STAS domain-containing protein [Betaproteobacteria bacterium]MDH4323679.1 STAS domain-containing protein [Betaproteobacteria bacterium]MDH5579043.1 STAS domain-containing protein [Betaproteobacteria bacterium]
MIRVDGERLTVSGPATLATAAQLLEAARGPLEAGVRTVDLGEVTELDSSLLAVLFAWMRAAKQRERPLALVRLPPDLKSLAQLYGVAELLPQEAAS